MNYDEMMAQGTDYGKKYCVAHDCYYEVECPMCEEQEECREDRDK